jgi:amidase
VALLLGAISGPATPVADYRPYLNADGLKGARLGIARKFFAENEMMNAFLDGCVALLSRAGAIVVDPADLPMHGEWEAPELEVLLYEFKNDLNAYLGHLPADFQVRSLEALIYFNEKKAPRELEFFGQELLRRAQAKGDLSEEAYRKARETCLAATRANGIDAVIAEHRLDAMVTLTSGPAWLIDEVNGDSDSGGCSSPAAIAGYPHITVPAGLHCGLPVGLSFFGPALSEPTLVRLASGFEHAASPPPLPAFRPGVGNSKGYSRSG